MKPKTYRSPQFLAFVRSLPCCVCGASAVPHHTETGGVGLKGDDLSCVPLCHVCHTTVHQVGRDTFEDQLNVDIKRENVLVLRKYIEKLEGDL